MQSVIVCCSVLVGFSMLQYVAVCCSVVQCVAVCQSALQCIEVYCKITIIGLRSQKFEHSSMSQCVAVCCSVW